MDITKPPKQPASLSRIHENMDFLRELLVNDLDMEHETFSVEVWPYFSAAEEHKVLDVVDSILDDIKELQQGE